MKIFRTWGILRALKGIEVQLERIGDAMGAPNPKRGGKRASAEGSWVAYTEDAEEARREFIRAEYEARTGARLPIGEAPPRITDGSTEWEEGEAAWTSAGRR